VRSRKDQKGVLEIVIKCRLQVGGVSQGGDVAVVVVGDKIGNES
jgi:hypothetical protein